MQNQFIMSYLMHQELFTYKSVQLCKSLLNFPFVFNACKPVSLCHFGYSTQINAFLIPMGTSVHQHTGWPISLQVKISQFLCSTHLGRIALLIKCNKCFLDSSQYIFDPFLIFISTNPFLFVFLPFVDMPKFCQSCFPF